MNALATRLRMRYRALRCHSRRWLGAHPRTSVLLRVTGALRTGIEPVARGIAVGLFVGLTPTVGAQTLLMIAGCMLVRGNFPAAFAVSWISNPLTLPALYWVFHETGAAATSALAVAPGKDVADGLFGLGDEIVVTAVGGLLVATPVALVGYFLTPRIAQVLRRQPRSAAGLLPPDTRQH